MKLAEEGAQVVINYSSDPGSANELVKSIGEDRSLAIQGDAGDVKDIEKMVKATVDRFQKIDILIPNAGITRDKDLASTTEEDFDVSIKVNVKGPYFLAQKAAPYMGEGSHVIFLSTSLCGMSTVTPNYLLYLTTKGAIEQMVRVLTKDLGRKRIYVNAVAPGPTGTALFYQGKSEQLVNTIAGFNPQNRIGTPEEIAESIVWLSGSNWVAGQIVRVNGGIC